MKWGGRDEGSRRDGDGIGESKVVICGPRRKLISQQEDGPWKEVVKKKKESGLYFLLYRQVNNPQKKTRSG